MSGLVGIALVNDPHALGLKLHPESLNNKVRKLIFFFKCFFNLTCMIKRLRILLYGDCMVS